MITFKTLRFKNFMSYGNYWSEIDLNPGKSTIIYGKNGHGKSTFLDAICYVLYGVAYRDVNLPQLVNSTNEKGMEVQIEFVTRGNLYKVVRGIGPKKFEIYENGELVKQDGASKFYQSKLTDEILQMDVKSFKQIVILGSANYVKFMSLSAPERRAVTESILDISIFSDMAKINKNRISDIDVDIGRIEKELEKIKYQIESANRQNELVERATGNEDARFLADIESLEFKLASVRADDLAACETSVNTAREAMESIQVNEDRERKAIDHRSKITAKKERNDKEIRFLESHTDCPTCAQHIDKDFCAQVIKDRTSENKKIAVAVEKLNEIIQDCTRQRKLHQKATMDYQSAQAKYRECQATIKGLEGEIARTQAARERAVKERVYERVETSDLIALESKFSTEIRDLKAKRRKHVVLSTLLKDTGIRARVIAQYLPVIVQSINDYLAQLELFVGFEMTDSFAESFTSRYRDKFTYNSFSEGQKMRIDLAILLTWREIGRIKNSVNTNLLIMDETFDSSLDEEGTSNVIKIINGIVGKDSNVFVISPKDEAIREQFESHIEVEMTKGFSFMK